MGDTPENQSPEIPISDSSLLKADHSSYPSKNEGNEIVQEEYEWGITTFDNCSSKSGHSMCPSKDEGNEIMKESDITTFKNCYLKDNQPMCPFKDKGNENTIDGCKGVITTLNTFSLKDDRPMSPPKDAEKENTFAVPQPLPFISPRPRVLDRTQEDMVRKLVFLQEKYESLSEDNIKNVTDFSLGVRKEDYMKRVKHITELTILTVKVIIDFSKEVPGFDTIFTENKIKLLKGCCIEVMLLRLARQYDLKTGTTAFGKNCRYTREIFRSSGMGGYSDTIFEFCRAMRFWNIDDAEYALITVILIFSKRRYRVERTKLKRLREFYTKILKSYIDINRTEGTNFFNTLLSNLAEMRKQNNKNSKKWFSIEISYDKPPQFLRELLGV